MVLPLAVTMKKKSAHRIPRLRLPELIPSGEVQDEKDANGTVVLSANRQWVVDVTLNVADPVITAETKDVANCSGNSESGYMMTNSQGAALGNFSCTVKDGAMTLIYITTVKDGRKTYTATNTFTGKLN